MKLKPKPKVAAGAIAGTLAVGFLALIDALIERGIAGWLAALIAVAFFFGGAWLKRD